MENASKALLMAAGVLIGLLIISLAVYLFVSFGSTSAEIHKQNEAQQIAQFNSQFTSYEGKDCTIYDVITLANLATDNNKYYGFENRTIKTQEKDNYISVQIRNDQLNSVIGVGYIEGGTNGNGSINYDSIIKKELENMEEDSNQNKILTKYKCEAYISETTQRVYYVRFDKKNT